MSGACTCLLYTPIACIYVTRQAPPDPSLAIPSELASRLRLRNTQHACAPSSSQLLQNSQLCNCRTHLTGPAHARAAHAHGYLQLQAFRRCFSVLSHCARWLQSECRLQVRCCVLACLRCVSCLISLVFCMNSCHFCSLLPSLRLVSAETWPRRLDCCCCALKKWVACAKCFLFARTQYRYRSVVGNIRRLAQLALERATKARHSARVLRHGKVWPCSAILRSDAIIVWLRAWCAWRSSRS